MGRADGGFAARLAPGRDLLFAVRGLLRVVADGGGEGIEALADIKRHRRAKGHRGLLYVRGECGKRLGAAHHCERFGIQCRMT